jgi:hypothetical protein
MSLMHLHRQNYRHRHYIHLHYRRIRHRLDRRHQKAALEK